MMKRVEVDRKPIESIPDEFYKKLGYCLEPGLSIAHSAISEGKKFVESVFKYNITSFEHDRNARNALELLDIYGYMLPKYKLKENGTELS